MTRARALLLLLACLHPAWARAAVQRYGVRLPADGLVVDVPYSAGTHHERVAAVDGSLRIDPGAQRVEGGQLVFPLSAFRDDNAQRACHLREALGLDYARSRYPREHACDDHDRLPESGPDAIAYPRIVLDLGQGGPAAGAPAGRVQVDGTLTVHGVSRPVHLDLAVGRDAPPGMLRVRGRLPLRLSDFGVQVKPAHVLFVTISVHDEITVEVDVLLEPLGTPGGSP